MATEVKVPALGESITSGILSAWHVQSGQYVESGQPIYDLETDKITSEGTAESAGTIELRVEEGDEVEIGAVVAVIDESAEKPSGSETESDSASGQPAEEADAPAQHPPSVRRIAAESGISPESIEGSGNQAGYAASRSKGWFK
jgi:2-oxoglutarate dehydrogenase E2 component (dihydrolipoamide succinyltransferase)